MDHADVLEVNDPKIVNAWLRYNGVEVGGGYSIGDTLPFDLSGGHLNALRAFL